MKLAVLTILLPFLTMTAQGMETAQNSLHWTIESFLSGFFSEKIYSIFQKHTPKENYAIEGEQLTENLQNEVVEMTKFGPIKVLNVGVSNISSKEERNQGDWAVFEVDIIHAGKPYYYAILTFKGTASMKDIFADADQNLVRDDLLDTLVPRGFHDSLNPIKNEFFASMLLEEEIFCYVYQKPDEGSVERNIIITGHSLGGALAKLVGARIKSPVFSALLKSNGYGYLLKPIEQARIYTFGAPQIFQKDFIHTIADEDASNYTHFQIASDPVPKLQLFKSYRKMFGKVCDKVYSLSSYFSGMIFGSKGETDESVETCEDVDFSDFGHFEILANYESENTTSLSVQTDMVEQAIEHIRKKAEKVGALKTLAELPNHAIAGYFKELKDFIQHESDEIYR